MSEEANRKLWLAVRQGLLLIVKAIEHTFDLRKTEDVMKRD
jgi:hypothetical protein